MVAIRRSALASSGSSGSTLTNIADSVAGSGAGSFVPGSSGGSWSNTTTIHTNDPASGRNESRLITESGHDHTVKVDLAVWASVGAFVGVAVFVGGLWAFTDWRNRRNARALARINNPVGAATERAAEEMEAVRRAANPRMGLLPRAARWVRWLLWDGFPEERLGVGVGALGVAGPLAATALADAAFVASRLRR